MVHTLVNQKITGGQCRPMTKEATWTQINADQICPKDQTVVKAIESDEAKDFIQRSQLPHLHCKSNPPTGERCPQQDLEERHEKTGKWVKYQP